MRVAASHLPPAPSEWLSAHQGALQGEIVEQSDAVDAALGDAHGNSCVRLVAQVLDRRWLCCAWGVSARLGDAQASQWQYITFVTMEGEFRSAMDKICLFVTCR